MSGRMRVLLDGTPLLGQRTGIGHYTAALAEELASMSDVDIRVVAFTLRGWHKLRSALPHDVWARGLPVSARLLRKCWARGRLPPIELFAGLCDVVHGTNYVLPPAIRAGGVMTVHDLAFLDFPEQLPPSDAELPGLVRRCADRAAVVCAPTRAVAERVMERLEVPADRVQVTPLGVDASWFAAQPPNDALRSRLRLPAQYLLFVGADGPRKGLSSLVAAHDSHKELPPLVLTGPGKSRLGERVMHTGYLSDVDLRRVMAGASALVLPSRDEGFGLPVLEALACNVPVVCTDIPALREVAGGQASLVPYGDVDALADALAHAMRSPPSADVLAARRAHAAGFTWQGCAQATVEAYRRAAR
ncbi:MAG: glycosyltransferase family 4 protein [Sciscionella sp.]